MKILITSGGTKIKIDRVRDITNMSTGTFGSKIAAEYLKLGHNVVFMKAKGSKSPVSLTADFGHLSSKNLMPEEYEAWFNEVQTYVERYNEYEYTTYEQYAEMLKFVIGAEQPDMILLAAAVSDYGVENFVDGKMRSNDMYTIKLCQLPKLINKVKEWAPKAKLVGFKLLVNSKDNELIYAAARSIHENGCDMVVANDLRDIKDANHTVHLVTKLGLGSLPNPLGLTNTIVQKFESKDKEPNYLAKMVVQESFKL